MSNPLDEMSERERLAAFDTLAARALKAWKLQPVALNRITCRENAVYSVELTEGKRLALRVHRHGYHNLAALQSELAWTRSLVTANVATPVVVCTPCGEAIVEVMSDEISVPHLCDVLEWVEGKPVGFAEDPHYPDHGSVFDTYVTVGRIAAQIHRHSASWQRPPGFVRPCWDREGCLGAHAVWGPWYKLSALEPEERRLLDAAVRVLERTLERLGQSAEVYGLIHADLVPDNLLEHNGRVVVLDFDDGGHGWYLFELATAVCWHLGESHYLSALEGYISGYRLVRQLSDDELQMLPQFLLMRMLVYMGWMQTRRTQITALRMTRRVRELSRALALRVLERNLDYRSIQLELSPLPET